LDLRADEVANEIHLAERVSMGIHQVSSSTKEGLEVDF
jgi:hypothetical protein